MKPSASEALQVEIARREQAEQALRESETRFRVTFEQAAVGICHVGIDGRFLRVNSKLCDILGYPREELLARSFQEISHPGELENNLAQLRRALAGGIDTYALEKRYIRKDGSILWAQLTVSVVRKKSGQPAWLISVIEDISARKTAEEALRRTQEELEDRVRERTAALQDSERRFREMADTAPVFIWVSDAEKGSTFWNQAWLEFTGSRFEEELGNNWKRHLHPDDYRDCEPIAQAARQARRRFQVECRVRRHDGAWCWVLDTAVPRFSPDGVFLGYIGSCIDIDDRKKAEAALDESHQLLNAIIEGTTDSVFIRDTSGRFTMINSAGERILGQKAVGKHVGELLPPDTAAEVIAQDREILASGETRTFEIAIPTATGLRTHLVTRGPHRDAHGNIFGVFGIARDITELRRMEKSISEISDREQQRIGQDLHDGVCQRLAGIGLLAGVLKSKLAAQWLGEAAEAAEIARLLEQTTIEARGVARGLYHVDPGAHGLMTALYELAGNTQRLFKITCVLRCEEPAFVDDSAKAMHLYRIAQEAVNNAVKHSGGTRVEIVLGETDGAITLTVRDDGTGMRAPQQASQGLGMHIMQYRARLIGAHLDIRPDSPRGTVVICSVAQESKHHP